MNHALHFIIKQFTIDDQRPLSGQQTLSRDIYSVLGTFFCLGMLCNNTMSAVLRPYKRYTDFLGGDHLPGAV